MKLDSVVVWKSSSSSSASSVNTLTLTITNQHTVIVLEPDCSIETINLTADEGASVWIFNFTDHQVSTNNGSHLDPKEGCLEYKSDGSSSMFPATWNRFHFLLDSGILPEIAPDEITVTPSTLPFSYNPVFLAGATNLTVESNGNWKVSGIILGGSCRPLSGSAGTTKVLFNPGTNNNTSSRSGTLTFTCGTASDTVTWTQAGKPETTLTIDPSFLSFPAVPTTLGSDIEVTCNGAWTASTLNSWIHLSKTTGAGNGTVTVTVDRNTSFSLRSGTITFKSGDVTRTCNVSQMASTIIPTSYYLTVNINGTMTGSVIPNVTIGGVAQPNLTGQSGSGIVNLCQIDSNDTGKAYTVRISSSNPSESFSPSSFSGTLPSTINKNFQVGSAYVVKG